MIAVQSSSKTVLQTLPSTAFTADSTSATVDKLTSGDFFIFNEVQHAAVSQFALCGYGETLSKTHVLQNCSSF